MTGASSPPGGVATPAAASATGAAPVASPAPARRRAWTIALLLFVLVVVVRGLLVGAYANPTPYWDQWDAEGAYLLQPWNEGTLPAGRLFEPHNEHRILWTRLISLGLFEANGGQWDNLVAAFANTLLVGLLCAALYVAFARGLVSLGARVVLAAALLAAGALPYGWENLLTGFQSQFYLLMLFAVATLAAAAWGRVQGRAAAGLLALAVGSVFTIATGMLAAVVAGGVLVLRAWLRQRPWRPVLSATALLAIVAIAALLAVPTLAGHQALKAQSAAEWAAAFAVVAGWPMPSAWAPALWLPAGFVLLRTLWRRDADAPTLFALGLAAWTLLQAAAMAYSRGHDLAGLPATRYTDVLALGVLANAWLAMRAVERAIVAWRQRTSAAAARPTFAESAAFAVAAALAIGPLLAGVALVARVPADLATLDGQARTFRVQAGNVRAYLVSGDRGHLVVPFRQIPYPDAGRLQSLLDTPALRNALPWPLRDERADGRPDAGPLSAAAAALQQAIAALRDDDAIGLPPDERAAWVRLADGAGEPLWLHDGAIVDARFRVPQGGALQRVGVQVGTGGQPLAGELRLKVCAATCVEAVARLDAARDNADLVFAFAEPLPLVAGKRARLQLTVALDGPPVALWLWPADDAPAPMRVRDAAGARRVTGRLPRLTLGLQR